MPPPRQPIAPGTRLMIIRHGEAVCNAEGFVGGPKSCRGLTDLGRRQCEALAARLEVSRELSGAVGVYTSDLPRAYETAAIIAPALGDPSVTRTTLLCEREPGEADGLSWTEFARRYRRSSTPGRDADLPLSPGGETWIEFLDRAEGVLLGLAADHPGGLVVIVAHGGIVDASMIRFLGLPEDGSGVMLHPENASMTEWRHTGQRWRLVRYSDAAHLSGTSQDLRALPPAWALSES